MTSVFLPGTLCDERVWKYQTERFRDSVVVNLRTQDTLESMLEAVREVEAESFALIGFSMGGRVALEFALKYPERVRKLVLIGASIEAYPEAEKELALKAIPAVERGYFKGITDRRLRDFLHPSAYENAELRALIQSMAGPDASLVYLNQLKATLDRRDLTPDIHSIRCPVLLVAGRDDRIVSVETMLRSSRAIPGSRLEIVGECGHFISLEKPAELNRILSDFLVS